jgi:predicted benzoate:H+ symporter BenE
VVFATDLLIAYFAIKNIGNEGLYVVCLVLVVGIALAIISAAKNAINYHPAYKRG